MKFRPEDAKEYAQPREGDFWFSVDAAEDAYSTKGNEMVKLKLAVDIDGQNVMVFDQLVNTPGALFRSKLFCRAVGLEEAFESGELTADMMVGCEGQARFKFGEEKTTARGNKVRYLEVVAYLPQNGQAKQPKPKTPPVSDDAPPPTDDDVPPASGEDDVPF